MKKFFASILLTSIFISPIASAQQMQWLNSTPVNYSLNPEMPRQPSCISEDNIYAARMVDFALSYGIDIYSSVAIDCIDTSGALLWSYPVGPKLSVSDITADDIGNVYVCGSYMETLILNGSDSLENTGSGFNTNLFLFSLDNTGNLRWKRNVTLTQVDAFEIPALAVDPQGNCWCGLAYFDSTSIMKLDGIGNDILSHSIHGTRTIGNFSFDPSGNLFVAGSAGFQTLSVNGYTVNVYEPYMMFLTRINNSGNTSWIKLAHDQTFQFPEVVATAGGDAYLSGNLMDSTSWGNVVFEGPQWVYDIFLTKVDSSGNFSWGIEVPETPNIVGDFQCGRKNFIHADDAGSVYLTGTIRGSVDWGNGVVTDAGASPSHGISIISFNGSGLPRWQKTGVATGFVTSYSVGVRNQDECYFSASAVGDLSFDSLTTNQGGNYAFVLGKISPFLTTAINEPIAADGLFVYPNPAKNKLAIRNLPTGQSGRQYAINYVSIYDFLGTMAMNIEVPAASNLLTIEMDISELQSGIYFLQTGNVRTKFIVQHN